MNVFQQALDVLNRDGWGQCLSCADDGRMCVGGAIGKAITGRPKEMYWAPPGTPLGEALTTFANHVGAQKTHLRRRLAPSERVSRWNDAKERTQDEVVRALSELAAA